jgi:CheY-like chemotaxis protein
MFARGGKNSIAVINVNDVVANTAKLVSRTFSRAIEVTTELKEGLAFIEADAVQIGQVVMNLCVNARDAMSGSGKLAIKTGSEPFLPEEAGVIIGICMKSGNYVYLSVKDTGTGMDKETSAKIFEPFFTTKGDGERTGLGLAVVYGIVKNHGGFIRVISEPDKGSEFRVYLPVSDRTIKEKSSACVIKPGKGKGEAILVVDDEKEIRNLAKRILESNGYKVMTASNGEEALKVFGESSKEISLLIMDMIMPNTDSNEVYAEMKRIKNDVKALISTGNLHNEKIEQLISMGALGVIHKPYSMNKLLSCVRNAIDSQPLA